jgi:hypothetical protein
MGGAVGGIGERQTLPEHEPCVVAGTPYSSAVSDEFFLLLI